MNSNLIKIIAVASLLTTFALGASLQSAEKKAPIKVKNGAICPTPAQKKQATKTTKTAKKSVAKGLPRLLDLGASKCVPCKMMVPVLDELTKEYKGKLKVQFVDVWKDDSAARKYGVQSIPTQIFFDGKGKEFYRHTGYLGKADIIKVFRNHGIKLAR